MLFPGTIEQSVGLLGLGAARTVPLAWSIPAFGGPSLPVQVRIVIGIGLAVLCLPVLGGSPLAGDTLAWVVLAMREMAVGLVMGFVCSCAFRAAEAAGEVMDVLRGGNLAATISPTGGNRTSPLGGLMLLLSTAVFLEIGGVGHVATALARSYEALPLGHSWSLGERAPGTVVLAIVASGRLIEAAIGLCAPVLVAILLADIALGVLGRTVPQIPLHSLGMPIKALLGLGIVLLGLAGLVLGVQGIFGGFMTLLTGDLGR